MLRHRIVEQDRVNIVMVVSFTHRKTERQKFTGRNPSRIPEFITKIAAVGDFNPTRFIDGFQRICTATAGMESTGLECLWFFST